MQVKGTGAMQKNTQEKKSNGSVTKLRKIVPEALDTCTPELNRKLFRKSRDPISASELTDLVDSVLFPPSLPSPTPLTDLVDSFLFPPSLPSPPHQN